MNYARKQTQINTRCRVLDISSFYATSKLPPDFNKLTGFEFLINPISLERSLNADWAVNKGLNTNNNYIQYTGSRRNTIRLSGCVYDSRCSDYDLQQYLDALENFIFVKPNTEPKILALTLGSRIIQPVVLTELSIIESSWANGYASSGTFDLSFEYIQPANPKPRVSTEKKETPREAAKRQKSSSIFDNPTTGPIRN